MLSTLEGWPYIYQDLIDSDSDSEVYNSFSINLIVKQGPSKDKNFMAGSLFCVCFICLGSFFFMNLFVGVLFNEYNTQLKLEKK